MPPKTERRERSYVISAFEKVNPAQSQELAQKIVELQENNPVNLRDEAHMKNLLEQGLVVFAQDAKGEIAGVAYMDPVNKENNVYALSGVCGKEGFKVSSLYHNVIEWAADKTLLIYAKNKIGEHAKQFGFEDYDLDGEDLMAYAAYRKQKLGQATIKDGHGAYIRRPQIKE